MWTKRGRFKFLLYLLYFIHLGCDENTVCAKYLRLKEDSTFLFHDSLDYFSMEGKYSQREGISLIGIGSAGRFPSASWGHTERPVPFKQTTHLTSKLSFIFLFPRKERRWKGYGRRYVTSFLSINTVHHMCTSTRHYHNASTVMSLID